MVVELHPDLSPEEKVLLKAVNIAIQRGHKPGAIEGFYPTLKMPEGSVTYEDIYRAVELRRVGEEPKTKAEMYGLWEKQAALVEVLKRLERKGCIKCVRMLKSDGSYYMHTSLTDRGRSLLKSVERKK